MEKKTKQSFIELDVDRNLWEHFYTVAPLVVIGTKEGDGFDLAPKHMATPLGYGRYFGFICTPSHRTFQNVLKEKAFTVSFPNPDQVVLASLTASPRCGDQNGDKQSVLDTLALIPSRKIEGVFLRDAYLQLECELLKVTDGFDDCSLISGKILAAYVAETSMIQSGRDDGEMLHASPLLAYLPYGRFAVIRDTLAFPFPKDFKK
jgi:flavin reductase (DIM6/NTAB) family NADH-FMN oxidoreductase RutF